MELTHPVHIERVSLTRRTLQGREGGWGRLWGRSKATRAALGKRELNNPVRRLRCTPSVALLLLYSQSGYYPLLDNLLPHRYSQGSRGLTTDESYPPLSALPSSSSPCWSIWNHSIALNALEPSFLPRALRVTPVTGCGFIRKSRGHANACPRVAGRF